MPANHIDALTIDHFKCFEHIELKSIRKVNLIGGKNNVGKTALLEAIELFVAANKPSQFIIQLHTMLHRRQDIQDETNYIELDFFYRQKPKLCVSDTYKEYCAWIADANSDDTSNEDEVSKPHLCVNLHKFSEKHVISTMFPLSQLFNKKAFNINNNFNETHNQFVTFIGAEKPKEQDIAILYGSLIDLDQEHFIDQSLALFDTNLVAIKQKATTQGVVLKVKLNNRKAPVLLSSLGDGVTRYIAILCAIWASKDGVLLIDEIENGIHYSNYNTLWQLIHQASRDANCQLFITSHSKECIEAFNTVQQQLKNPDSAYIEIYRHMKKDIIQLSQRDPQQLQYALQHNGKIRGE